MSDYTVTRVEGVEEWTQRILVAVGKTLEAHVALGRELQAAKKALPGEFEQMIETRLPFSPRWARKLMTIADCQRFRKRNSSSVLPCSPVALYELSRLDDTDYRRVKRESDLLRLDTEWPEIRGFLKGPKGGKAQNTADGCTVDDLRTLIDAGHKFGSIYADPPWSYGNQSTRAATDNHYETMTVDDMCELPIEELAAEKSLLHMWTTNGFLFESQRLMEAWGFTYKSCFVWVKPQMGIGNYWRVSHEFMLLGNRGGQTFEDASLMSWMEAPRTKHSAKPAAVRDMVERAGPGPYLELFGRREVPGWMVWGNEIERDLFVSGIQP